MEDQRTPEFPHEAVTAAPTGTSRPGWASRLGRCKPIDQLAQETGQLRRSLGLAQLTMISIGATLGTGIFVVLGEAVPKAGPAVVLSFVLAGATALFSALSYAELAGMIPASGSSYSYAYATLGELVAWVCGWCLILEYGVSVAAVAVGWGQYLNELLRLVAGVTIPEVLSQPPGEGGVINLPAVAVVVLAMFLLFGGARESARANAVMVVIKVLTLLVFCAVAFTAVGDGNFTPFLPLGMAGVSAAGATLFFSYIGFDAASTAGEEARDAKRDLPRAIVLSLLVVTALYCLVALAAVGAMPWTAFDSSEAVLSQVLARATGAGAFWSVLLSLGALVAIASVVLAVMYGQTRILFAMSRDGLVPRVFAEVDRRTGTPRKNVLLTSLAVAVLSAVVPLGALADATSIGTLFAFGLVNIAVLVLRRTRPELPRGFRVPLAPFTPVLGAGFCLYLMSSLGADTWVVFCGWMVLGLLCYFGYGIRHSRLRDPLPHGSSAD
ncbi:amino acid permease [Actinopolyspora mortivallis]|uniref:amino acid permease n=1 Tax=Actinopolyspora mortivallis TaxID=33906 RepID=UPI000363A156|nr:amino acid permease [Actinopolyspora mortivallis]